MNTSNSHNTFISKVAIKCSVIQLGKPTNVLTKVTLGTSKVVTLLSKAVCFLNAVRKCTLRVCCHEQTRKGR